MTRFTKLLVPLDGSELAEQALPLGEWLAHSMDAEIVLVRAAEAHSFPGVDPAEAQRDAVVEAEAYLDRIGARLAAMGIRAEQAVPYGPAAESILLEIGLRKPDVVVMTTHGRTGVRRFAFGSVALDVLRWSPAPVLLHRAGTPALTLPPHGVRVLVALDGSELAEAALEPSEALVRALDGEIVLAQVVPAYGMTKGGPFETGVVVQTDAAAAARTYLHAAERRLNGNGVRARSLILEGEAAPSLARMANALPAHVLALATHGRSGLPRVFLGSVAEATVAAAEVPVLVFRPAAMRAQ